MVARKNEPKPSLIVIMVARTHCLYIKQASSRTPKSHLLSTVPLHHYIVRGNANKSHHLLYLWQQQKNEPKPSLIVIMAARKNEPTPTTYYTYDNTKKHIAIEFLLLSM
jgi:hypothetical protein